MFLSSTATCIANPNGTCHGDGIRVANAEVPFSNASFRRRVCSPTPKLHTRGAARLSMRDHVRKSNAGPKAGAQRLQYGLLGSKPSGQVLYPFGSTLYFVQLHLSETSRKQRVEWIIDPSLHLGDIHHIYPMSDNGHVTHLCLFFHRSK